MFRTLLIAVLSALALSSIAVGSAQAATPAPTVDAPICAPVLSPDTKCDSSDSSKISTDRHYSVPGDRDTESECNALPGDWRWDPTPAPGRCERDDRSGPIFGGHNGPIRTLPRYNSCDDYRSHGIRDIRRGDARWNDSWDRNRDGTMCDDGDVVAVSSNGDCTTYATARDSIRNYGLAYNRYSSQYRSDWNRMSSRDRTDFNRLYQLNRRYESEGWNSSRLSNFRTVCKDTSPTVTIINQAPPAVVTSSAPTYTAPAPQVSTKPEGGAETGGLDEAHYAG
jgi:hypothetical protein